MEIFHQFLFVSKLSMKDLPTYAIPMEFIEVEFYQKNDSPTLDDYKTRPSDIRSNTYDYINGYKAMVFMEEAAEMKYVSKFKHVDIRLHYDDGKGCYFFPFEVRFEQSKENIQSVHCEYISIYRSGLHPSKMRLKNG